MSWGESTEGTPVVHPGPPSGKEMRDILETVHADRWQGEEGLREVKENQKFAPRGQCMGALAETGEKRNDLDNQPLCNQGTPCWLLPLSFQSGAGPRSQPRLVQTDPKQDGHRTWPVTDLPSHLNAKNTPIAGSVNCTCTPTFLGLPSPTRLHIIPFPSQPLICTVPWLLFREPNWHLCCDCVSLWWQLLSPAKLGLYL